ncbi:hypothetical protein I302_106157 [Kwoniella bestiolae CBS 10118]|uniref:DUF7719 domain-containing protein n=1 Tax=Kwoniella bestiolae CBS 10118 TaxID=1296100 RepID=A0A1B9G383_9TREE|nr:hypothetical protein I302_05280 [Kwoniella bestiolae CBS 10118]OCF25460.1 hypothetical protein I302_05280 [Kwoniella bestiolae CBS 10118]
MAILEELPQSPSPTQPSTRQRKTKNKAKTKEEPTIPLKKPSTLPFSTSKPLIDVDLPDNAGVYTINPGEIISEDHITQSERTSLKRHGERKGEGGEGEGEGEEEEDDEIFNTLIVAVPFTFLYLLLDILVHLQYNHRPGTEHLVRGCVVALPTNRHANHWITNSFLISSSIIAGCRLIWLVNKASWSVVTAEAPPVGTLWILTIVQLPLSRAVLALLAVGGWIWWKGMKLMP